MIKLQRKLKKRIIKTFGRGTYIGLVCGFLELTSYKNNIGVTTIRTDKQSEMYWHGHQYNPYLTFPKIYHKS